MLAEAERFAAGGYPNALAQGNRIPADYRAEVVTRLASLTGLSEDYIDRVNLRIEHMRFFAELLRSRRQVVGRLDGRFAGWDADYGVETPGNDPSFAAIIGPYTAALNHYVRMELGYQNDLPYEILTRRRARTGRTRSSRASRSPSPTSWRKRCAPTRTCKVHVASGHYDGATPYFATENTSGASPDPRRTGRQHRDRSTTRPAT